MFQLLTPLLAYAVFGIESVEAAPGLWEIHIDKNPAPLPEDDVPLSATATRDPSKLKFELTAIFASYAVWLALTLLAIILARRRLRRITSRPALSYKMDFLKFKPHATARQLSLDKQPLSPKYPEPKTPKSPKSPGKMASIVSWKKEHRSKPSDATLQTIDSRVLDSDKTKNMDEMTKLYAAVMAHDEERSLRQASPSIGSDVSPVSQGNSPVSQFSFPEFQHLRNPNAPAPTDNPQQQQAQMSSDYDPRYGPTPSSFVSAGTTRVDSADSHLSKQSHVSVRGRPISRPVAMADLEQSAAYGLPSSPRMFNPGPPPPVPGSPESTKKREFDRRAVPKPLPLKSEQAGSSSNLPFRQMYSDSLKSAPSTKTTFLERKDRDHGPMTGVPYSPYTPFTPMTPLTPRRLPTKQELKQSRKKGPLTALREDGLVASDEDMWGGS